MNDGRHARQALAECRLHTTAYYVLQFTSAAVWYRFKVRRYIIPVHEYMYMYSRSADGNLLTVPRTHIRLGDRSFSAAGPRIWNNLPASLRQPDIEFGHFRRLLKAFLF